MKAIGSLFIHLFDSCHRLFDSRPTRKSIYTEWDKQRNLAKSFGPTHVAEIDAIFSRNI